MNLKRVCIALILGASFLRGAVAAVTNTWEFDSPTNYIFDANRLEVTNSRAQLVLQAVALTDAAYTDYTNGVQSENLSYDESVNLQLAGAPGTYSSNGVFTSRVMDAGTGNQWKQLGVSASFEPYITDPDVVMYYAMDNDAWFDQATKTYASVIGSPFFTPDAKQGLYAGAFTGPPALTADYLLTANNNPLFGANRATIMFWMRLNKYSDYMGVFGGLGSGTEFRIQQNTAASRSLRVIISTTGTGWFVADNVSTGVWTHVALTWDGSGASDGFLRMYLNAGAPRLSASAGTGTINFSGRLYIATDPGSLDNRALDGNLDAVVMMRRALTAEEIGKVYEAQSPIFQPVRVRVRSGPDVPTLASRIFVGPDTTTNSGYVAGYSPLVVGGNFDTFDRYVQYQALLVADRDRLQTPFLRSVNFQGSAADLRDHTAPDIAQGTRANLTLIPSGINSPYVGLAKRPNGGFYTNGVYLSRVFDAQAPVQWERLGWQGTYEIPVSTPGLISLWHMDQGWGDSKGSHAALTLANPLFSLYAKIGTASAVFNGIDTSVSGFGNLGVVYGLDFWIEANEVDNAVMSLTASASVVITNRALRVIGIAPTLVTAYVNGSPLTSRLLAGWNHIAVTIRGGLNMNNSLTLGQIPGGGFLTGKLDELAVYNRELSAAEVNAHYTAGQREAAGQINLQVSDDSLTNFFGPGGPANGANNYFTFAPQPGSPNLIGEVPLQRRFRYKAVLKGDGNGTPVLRNVHITTGLPNATEFVDDTAAAFYEGTRVSGESEIYGGLISFEDVRPVGPVNLTAQTPLAIGIWNFDDDTWSTGDHPVRATKGQPGFAYGDARPSFGTVVGTKSGAFDGAGDYVDTIASSVAIGDGDFSASLWFKSGSGNPSTLFALNDSSRNFLLQLNTDGFTVSSGVVAFAVNDGTGLRAVSTPPGTAYNDSRWHQVVGVRQGEQLLLYLDGARINALLVPGLGNCGLQAGYIVAKHPANNTFYAGLIDEVAVFQKALSDSEIGDYFGAAFRSGIRGEYESAVFTRPEPSIWQRLQWSPMGPYGRPLSVPAAAEERLIGLWHMDASGGNVVSNAFAANGLHGTSLGGVTIAQAGRFGRSLDFNAALSQYVQVTHDSRLEPSPESLTVEAWVNMDFVDNRTVLAKRSGANSGYDLYTDATGRPVFGVGSAACVGNVPVRVKKWTHLAGVYTGARLLLYMDGQPVAAAQAGGTLASGAGADLLFGRNQSGANYFDGRMDEVAVHGRALSYGEVLDHYLAGALFVGFQGRTASNETFTTSYVGPGRSTNNFFTAFNGSDMTADIDPGVQFQYRIRFESEDACYAPDLRGQSVYASGYPTINPTIYPVENQAAEFPGNLLSFEHLRVNNPNTDVKYQISGDRDAGLRWYYWDDSTKRWTAEDLLGLDRYLFQASSVSEVSTNINKFYNQVYNKTGGVFRFRAFLHSTGETQPILDWVRLNASPGRIVVTSPDGDENGDLAWLVGVPYDITWTHTTNLAGTVTIKLSTSAGASFPFTIAQTVPVTNRVISWLTPTQPTTQAMVQVIYDADQSIIDQSDRTFTLQQGLQIVDNNGGTNIWYLGETNTIIWRKSTNARAANLYFSPDGTFTGNEVRITASAQGASPVNTFAWVTPMTNASLVSEAGKLRVVTPPPALPVFADNSDDFFKLAGGVIVSPALGQGVKRGASFDVQWVSAGMGSEVRIELQTAPGGPWEVLAPSWPNVSGLNQFAWTPTNNPTLTARIRLSSLSDPRAKGLSDEFVIAAVELISPRGNPDLSQAEVWLQQTTQSIIWISGGAGNFVNLSFSTDSGQTFTTITNGYPNLNGLGISNVYRWIVPPLPSETVRVRVEDAAKPLDLFSVTPDDFQIAGLRIVTPNGRPEYWNKGEDEKIRWEENAVDTLSAGTVEFSDDNGVTWLQVAKGPLIGNLLQTYSPTNPTLNALVRITSDNPPAPFTNITDRSDASFPVRGIRLVKPDLSSKFTAGQTNLVTFVIADPQGSSAQIFYSGDDGVTYDSTPLTSAFFFQDGKLNTFNWTVELDRDPSVSARVRVSAGTNPRTGLPYIGDSDPFTLRGIKFTSPLSGTVWGPGNRLLNWISAGIDGDAHIEIRLSVNGGAPGTYTNVIAADIGLAEGLFTWAVPLGLGPATNARLRIAVLNSPVNPDAGYTAESKIFTLQGLRVLNPSAVSLWDLGATQNLVWDSASGGSPVDLLYSSDGGVTFDSRVIRSFVPSVSGTNAIPWTIDMARTPSTNAMVRVASQQFAGLLADSRPFTVRGIKVTRPSGSDIYATTDKTNLITWVGVPSTNRYTLSYITNGGPAEVLIAANVVGPTYNWGTNIPPAAISDNIRIKVTDGFHSNTSAVFRIVSQPTIDIAAPDSGDFRTIGSVISIQWNRGGQMTTNFTVSYSLAPYNVTNQIVGPITLDGQNNVFSMPWQIADQGPTQAVIVVQNNDTASIRDVSGVFNIVGEFEIINPPFVQQSFALRPNTPIRWRTRGSVRAVDLYYSDTLAHEGSSWIKINSTPIANNWVVFDPSNPDDSWREQTYPWTVVNARTSLAKIRVQEAAYPQLFEPKTASDDQRPFDDSDPFSILYYTIYWDVFDTITGNQGNSPLGRLDHLSFVDSSGFAVSDASTLPPNVVKNDYPWGTFNTEIYRVGFFDASILFWSSENIGISFPGPQTWTQHVAMARSQITEAYHVLGNFSYDTGSTNFTIHAWMERGGVILTEPAKCTVTIYDDRGGEVEKIVNDPSQPTDAGIFRLIWDASGRPPGSVWFAKIEIEYSGSVYSSGLTFTLVIPFSDAITPLLQALLDATNIFSELTNVSAISSDIRALKDATDAGFTNLAALARFATNQLGKISADTETLTNAVLAVIGPKLDSLSNAIVTIGGELAAQSRILSRPDTLALGSTNSMLYKTAANYDPGTVLMQVERLSGAGIPPADMTLDALPIAGLYAVDYVADWGLGNYRITVRDPNARDSFVLRLVAGDIYGLPSQMTSFSNQLDAIQQEVLNLAVSTGAITNELIPRFEALNQKIDTLTNNLSVNFKFMEDALRLVTNQIGALAGLENIANDVTRLTNAVAQISSITNVSKLVAELTNALAGFSAADINIIKAGVAVLTNDLYGADWSDITNLQSGIADVTNTLGGAGGISAKLDDLTNLLNGVNFKRMAGNVDVLTNKLLSVDFALITRSVLTNTYLLQNIQGLSTLGGQLSQLSNSLAQISGLTNMTPTISALGAKLLPIDFARMEQNIQSVTNTLVALGNLGAISDKIGGLSNSIEQLVGLTNIAGTVDQLGAALLGVDYRKLARDMDGVTNKLEALSGLQALADQIGQLSNSLGQIAAVTNITGQVRDLWTEMQSIDMAKLGVDVALATNQLALVRRDTSGIGSLSNQMAGVIRDLTSVTNKLAPFDWSVILGIQGQVARIDTNIASLSALGPTITDALRGLTNSIQQLSAITNLGAQVSSITNALKGLNWDDVTYIKSKVDVITNQIAVLNDLQALKDIAVTLGGLSNTVSGLTSLTNMQGQVNLLIGQLGGIDFKGLTNDVQSVLNQVAPINWGDVTDLRTEVQNVTNLLAGLSGLNELLALIPGLTNSVGDLTALTNLSAQVNQVAAAVAGVDFLQLARDVQTTTNQLASMNTAELSNAIASLADLTNSLSRLMSLTNLSSQLEGITNAISGVTNTLNSFDWTDITKIKASVSDITNQLSTLGTVVDQLDALTNAIGEIGDLGNLEAKITTLTNQLQDVNWGDIAGLQADMQVVTNSLASVAALSGLAGQIDGLIASLNTVTNISGDVAALSATFANANWDQIDTMQTSLTSLGDSLSGLDGVDLATFDPAAVTRVEATLQSMATVDVVSEMERLLGRDTDSSEADTLFGRMTDVATKLSVVGVDAKNAAQRAQNAKSKAGDAADGIQSLQSLIQKGDLEGAQAALRQIQASFRQMANEVQLIPKGVETDNVFRKVRDMADTVNQLAASKGFPNLLNFEGPGAGAAGGGLDADAAKLLNQQIQEVRVGMEFMKELVDEMRFEPVVHESLLGVE